MKTLIITLLILVVSLELYSQDITNTLGAAGLFKIKDASNDYLTLSQSTGQVNILNSLRLENTNNTTTGVIFKGLNRFLHNYYNGVSYNTFLGFNSGNFTLTTANSNTGIGHSSLRSLTTGDYNTALGRASLELNTTGYSNTAVGYFSLSTNTTGYSNTAVGDYSLFANTEGNYNTTVGYYSLSNNTTGYNNSAFGYRSLESNTTGVSNSAFGKNSLLINTTGYNNSAFGGSSLSSNTTGFQNSAFGINSLFSNTTGSNNSAFGINSLFRNTTGTNNSAFGINSLSSNTTGSNNSAFGLSAGSSITSGSNLTCLGYNAEPTSNSATNQITLGNSAVTSLRCNVQTITSLSDARDKKNIKDLNLGIDFLMKLKPRQYNWDKREWYENNISDGSKMKEEPTAGFIAQELDEVQTTENAEWLNLVLKDNPDKWEATPGNLLPVIVKAFQDLKSEKDEEIADLKQENEKLVSEVDELKQKNERLSSEVASIKLLNDKVSDLEKIVNEISNDNRTVSFSTNTKKVE